MKKEQYKTPHFTKGRAGEQVRAIIMHVIEGTFEGMKSWGLDPTSKVSYHYVIAKDGRIGQWVKEEDQAWHAGGLDRPRIEYTQWHNSNRPNQITIGIGIEGFSGEAITKSQNETLINIVKEIVKRYNWIDLEWGRNILEHASVNPISRGRCPGTGIHITDHIILPVNKALKMEKLEKDINNLQEQLLKMNIERENYRKLYHEAQSKYHDLYSKYEKLYNERIAKKIKESEKLRKQKYPGKLQQVKNWISDLSKFLKD